MSLILEALKKSEAQRRLGEMPDLGTPITATRRRRSPLPWLAFAAIVALAAAGGWRFLQRPAAPVPAAAEPAPVKTAAKPDAAEPATARRTPPKPTPPITSIPAPPAAPAKAETTLPVPTTPAPEPPRAAAPAVPAAQTPARKETAPAAAASAAVPAPVPAPAAVASDVPSLDDLPPEVRSALPSLPISMQVYSSDPKRRFVIIDGTRVVEGDGVHGVTVQEIRPNGLVIEFQGRRVLLPRPGS